jgi:hypothetical protein
MKKDNSKDISKNISKLNKYELHNKLKKLKKQISLYIKKEDNMGLDDDEYKEILEVAEEFKLTKIVLGDMLFDEYILSKILDKNLIKIKQKLEKYIGWDTSIPSNAEIEEIVSKYNSLWYKDEVEELLANYHVGILAGLNSLFSNSDYLNGLKTISNILRLKSTNNSAEILKTLEDHIDYKFKIIYTILS